MTSSQIDRMKMERLEAAERELRDRGFVRCDMAACNCHGWHGGHSAQRLIEIGDALIAAGIDLNGPTILDGVKTLAEKLEAAEADTRKRLEVLKVAAGALAPFAATMRVVELVGFGDDAPVYIPCGDKAQYLACFVRAFRVADAALAQIRAALGKEPPTK